VYQWLALTYIVPSKPSKNRVYVWRKMNEIGAIHFRGGMGIIPEHVDKKAPLLELAEHIRSIGGEAALLHFSFENEADEREVIDNYNETLKKECMSVAEEYLALMEQINEEDFASSDEKARRAHHLLEHLKKLNARNYFGLDHDDFIVGDEKEKSRYRRMLHRMSEKTRKLLEYMHLTRRKKHSS